GLRAYVNVRVKVMYSSVCELQGCVDADPLVRFEDLDVTDRRIEGEGTPEVKPGPGPAVIEFTQFTFSLEADLPAFAIDFYGDYLDQLAWYEQAKKAPGLIATDIGELNERQREMEWRFNTQFNDLLNDLVVVVAAPTPSSPQRAHAAPAPRHSPQQPQVPETPPVIQPRSDGQLPGNQQPHRNDEHNNLYAP